MTLQQIRITQTSTVEAPTIQTPAVQTSNIDDVIGRRARFVTEALDITLHADDEYRLDSTIGTIGFVGRVGNRFVALVGSRRDAVANVGESLSFDTAVALVVSGYRNQVS